MFFILSKLFSFITTPIIWVFILIIFALFKKHPSTKKRVLISAFSIFYFFSNSFIFNEIVRAWEIPLIKAEQLTDIYDAGIVLGGISAYDEINNKVQFFAGSDRLFQGIALYKAGKIKKIFFVGGSGSLIDSDRKEAVFIHSYLVGIGIPEQDIIIESESKNTYENAVNTKAILGKDYAHGKYLLITSASHMRRALACFDKAGVLTKAYSTDKMSATRRFIFDQLFIPNAQTLYAWNALIHEWIGYLSYKIAGYI